MARKKPARAGKKPDPPQQPPAQVTSAPAGGATPALEFDLSEAEFVAPVSKKRASDEIQTVPYLDGVWDGTMKGLARGRELGIEEGRKIALRDAARHLLEQAGAPVPKTEGTTPPPEKISTGSKAPPPITDKHIKVLEALQSHFPASARQAQLEADTNLDRCTIGPLLADLREWGYAERPGGPRSRKGDRITFTGLAVLRDQSLAH